MFYVIEYSQDKTTEVNKMNKSTELLRYGTIKADVTTDEKDGCRRIRVIELDGKKYIKRSVLDVPEAEEPVREQQQPEQPQRPCRSRKRNHPLR